MLVGEGSCDGAVMVVVTRSDGGEASLGGCCWASTADDGLSGGTKGKLGILSGGGIQVAMEFE